jgi:hypothetical protein
MAFATQNVRRSAFGDLKVTAGDWTGNAGDANGTLNVEGGRVYHAEFSIQDGTTPSQYVPWTTSSVNPVAISVANRQTTTTGRFLVIHA